MENISGIYTVEDEIYVHLGWYVRNLQSLVAMDFLFIVIMPLAAVNRMFHFQPQQHWTEPVYTEFPIQPLKSSKTWIINKLHTMWLSVIRSFVQLSIVALYLALTTNCSHHHMSEFRNKKKNSYNYLKEAIKRTLKFYELKCKLFF